MAIRSKAAGSGTGLLHVIPRHTAFAVSAAVGAAVVALGLFRFPEFALGAGANTMFAVYLAIVFYELPRMTPAYLKQHADREDPPFLLIIAVVIVLVSVAVFSLFSALNAQSTESGPQILLSLTSVVLGWFVVHTMMALHYAYEFYESPSEGAGKRNTEKVVGGFEWPDGDPPNGAAFVYVAYQVGSAVQISDVPATSNKMRAIVVAHTTFSFFYNTMLLAAAVNVVINAAGGG